MATDGLGRRGRAEVDHAFTEFYTARGASMRSMAYLMCGDWHLAEDLVQIAFTKLYLAWNRVSRHDVLDGYVRQIVVRAFLDNTRRPWRREQPTDMAAGSHDVAVADSGAEDRLVLLRALAKVPPRQRAVLVLRYWEDMSVEQTAAALGCSPGTVKSSAARGLDLLRHELNGSRVTIDAMAGE
jgi:RNA polymerase sigma-70 factor (sigma-E family)